MAALRGDPAPRVIQGDHPGGQDPVGVQMELGS